jgi:hypothetical protein
VPPAPSDASPGPPCSSTGRGGQARRCSRDASAHGDYAGVFGAMRGRGAAVPERFLVLRDGERPRKNWPPVAGTAILLLVVAVNVRALVRALLPRSRRIP